MASKTSGYNSRLQIGFSTDKRGRPIAYYWSGRGYPGNFAQGRWIRLPLLEAQNLVAQEEADRVVYMSKAEDLAYLQDHFKNGPSKDRTQNDPGSRRGSPRSAHDPDDGYGPSRFEQYAAKVKKSLYTDEVRKVLRPKFPPKFAGYPPVLNPGWGDNAVWSYVYDAYEKGLTPSAGAKEVYKQIMRGPFIHTNAFRGRY